MRADDIPDTEISSADPEALIKQYEPWIFRLANRYIPILERYGCVGLDDLEQAGRIAILQAQKNYDPDGGASFMTFSRLYIMGAMRRALGFNSAGELPPVPVYLDAPITADDGEETPLVDLIPDNSIPDNAERLAEEAERDEISQAVHDALDRLKSENQRAIISRSDLAGEQLKNVASDLGISVPAARTSRRDGLHKLQRDIRLYQLACNRYPHHVTLSKFRRTWASEQEDAVLYAEERYDQQNGVGSFAELIRQMQSLKQEKA